ncbi:cytochrome c-550 PedF [Sagittula marina]|uniref:Cytochrome c-550 PedF n=1 Tax=Sagittula marina TaxID=943940 RepID=A0A7W6GUK1_9RHOB|nr:cytochrome c-550 PedF [Sagittula marina]MBB3987588.1 cytochrome c-550 PedF [Sagittula marina]
MKTFTLGALVLALPVVALAHGNVAPQAVDTAGLPAVGEEWLTENPYRVEEAGEEVWAKAVEIGSSGYNQNCARCHGLEVISGGLAPDLRFLEAEEYGDEWFIERFRTGYTQNGTTKMPAFGELLGQEAAWAIRTYIETRPDDDSAAEYADELKAIRDQIVEEGTADDATKERLTEIAENIETMSGAPVADSAASRAAALLDGTEHGAQKAAEALTIGLSAAH